MTENDTISLDFSDRPGMYLYIWQVEVAPTENTTSNTTNSTSNTTSTTRRRLSPANHDDFTELYTNYDSSYYALAEIPDTNPNFK